MATLDVAELLGISYRMVDYWSRMSTSGVLSPMVRADGSGSSRGYSAADVARLQKACCLVRALAPLTGGGRNSAAGIRIETLEQFVLEAEPFEGGWRWVTDDFDLRVG
jgi:hypothetical protein